jgi:hypothetical protein
MLVRAAARELDGVQQKALIIPWSSGVWVGESKSSITQNWLNCW